MVRPVLFKISPDAEDDEIGMMVDIAMKMGSMVLSQ